MSVKIGAPNRRPASAAAREAVRTMSGRLPRPSSLAERPGPPHGRSRLPHPPAGDFAADGVVDDSPPAQQLEGDPVVPRRDHDLEAACLERSPEGQQVLHLRRVVDVDPDQRLMSRSRAPEPSATRARPQYIQAVDQRMYGIRFVYRRRIWKAKAPSGRCSRSTDHSATRRAVARSPKRQRVSSDCAAAVASIG